MKPVLTLLAALDQHRLIGADRQLPWKLPADVARFRNYTQGKWILVGRLTFEEMSGWFTDHTPLVLTAQLGYDASPGCVVASVEEALRLSEAASQPELVCIGGGKVFEGTLPHADKLVLTYVEGQFPHGAAAAFFPEFNPREWEQVESKDHPIDSSHQYAMRFVTLRRRSPVTPAAHP